MAVMHTRAGCGCKGCLLTTIIVVILIIALVGIGVAVVLNMTPAKLGLGETVIFEGQTVNELGLGDMKIKEIFTFVKSISAPNEANILTNKFDKVEEKTTSDKNFASATIPKKPDGTNDYLSVLDTVVVYDNNYLVTYKDTTLAYMFNSMIADATASATQEPDFEFLKQLNANIVQVSIVAADGGYHLKVVVCADITTFKDEIKASGTPGFILNRLPNKVYITSVNTLTAANDGKLSTTPKDIFINDYKSSALTDAIFNAIAKSAAAGTTDPKAEINNQVGSAFCKVTTNLGKVGTATVGENNIVNGAPTYGVGGIAVGKISVITLTSKDVGV